MHRRRRSVVLSQFLVAPASLLNFVRLISLSLSLNALDILYRNLYQMSEIPPSYNPLWTQAHRLSVVH
jgi:hypothetical protein